MAGEEKSGGAPAEEKPLVGVEGAWPVLVRLMGVLGFVLPKRRSAGHYETSYARLIPMVVIAVALFWHLLVFPRNFTNVAYDQLMDSLAYATNFVYIIYAFVAALFRRRETCKLFGSLDGKLKPARTWVSFVVFLFFSLYVAFFLAMDFYIMDWTDVSFLHCICLTMTIPLLPSFLDLYLAVLIHAVAQVHREWAEQVSRSGRPWASSGGPGKPDESSAPSATVSAFVMPHV